MRRPLSKTAVTVALWALAVVMVAVGVGFAVRAAQEDPAEQVASGRAP